MSGELTYLCKKGLGNQQDLKRHEENLQKRLMEYEEDQDNVVS